MKSIKSINETQIIKIRSLYNPNNYPDNTPTIPTSDLTEQLDDDLNLLTPGQQIRDRHTGHSGHLDAVYNAHQLIHETERQKGVFKTVNSQSTTSYRIGSLHIRVKGHGKGIDKLRNGLDLKKLQINQI